MKKSSARDLLHSEIIDYMKKLGVWDETLVKELPKFWENYNGFIVFSIPSFQSNKWKEIGSGLWEIVCTCLRGHSVAIKGKITNNSFRSPSAKLVHGHSPIVNYLDNGVVYSWNVEKNMFCAGNVTERHRVASFDCSNEVVVDLFAGIGYFTIPYLVHAKAKFVHACEWNPDAVESLRRNLVLNKVEEKCEIYEGDNRVVCPKRVGNRINLGLIPSSEDYWDVACEALLETGGVLYIHSNVTSQIAASDPCDICMSIIKSLNIKISKNMLLPDIIISQGENLDFSFKFGSNSLKWKHPEWFIFSIHISHVLLNHFKILYSKHWCICVDFVFRVKSYAPHIDHLVYTTKCTPELVTNISGSTQEILKVT